MKGNKMSAILAILLMLSGAFFVPKAFAARADAVQPDPIAINWEYPAHGPGETFTVYVDVINVDGLFSFQVGFRYDTTVLNVLSIAEGGFLSNNGVDPLLSFPGSINEGAGIVVAYGWSLMSAAQAKTGSGHLIRITFQIEPTLWPPYSGTYPGTAVTMVDLTDVNMDPCELILVYKDGLTEITPLPENIHDGTFRLYVTPHDPIAEFSWTPIPAYMGEDVNFDASGSTRGWNGWDWVDIVAYYWDWDGDCTTDETDTDAYITHQFTWTPPPEVMSFNVGLIVEDADGRVSTKRVHTVQVIVRPTGPVIDLQSQRWRYQDPTLIPDPFFGEGPNFPCDLFRPGEWVQLWAYVSYNGDPVQDQLVAFEVRDNQGNIVVTGTDRSDENGWALYEFRIPWPCTGPEPLFGEWTAIAKWSIGELGGKPFMKTINDTMSWKVGWGLWIVDKVECDELGNPKGDFFKSELVYVKLTIQNDYFIARVATITVTIYDDLMVPLGSAILTDYNLMPGQTVILMVGIHIPKWAYVGTGTAKANLFTKLPFLCGTSWCPEVTNTFVIKKTPGEPWVPDP